LDRAVSTGTFAILSVPTFVSGLVLALVLTVEIHAFPRAGWVPLSADLHGNLEHAFLPSLVLALAIAPFYTRLLRAELIQTLQEDFILFAQAKGLPVRTVLFRYALRPSSLSLVTLSGLTIGALIGGTVIVETVYALPGLGTLLVNAVGVNDYPLVQGIVLVVGVAYVLVNLLVDLSYGLLDPRTRRGVA
jgi:peptide/nickel transport system permease protein